METKTNTNSNSHARNTSNISAAAASSARVPASQQSSTSRKGVNVKSQGSKIRDTKNSNSAVSDPLQRKNTNDQRGASDREYNKQGPASASRSTIKNKIRGTSQGSNKRHSSIHLDSARSSNILDSTANLKQSINAINAIEETKQATSSKSNLPGLVDKKETFQSNASSKAVSKKKKSKNGTVSGTVSSKDQAGRDLSPSKVSKFKKSNLNSQAVSDKSAHQKDESAIGSNNITQALVKKAKSGSSASARVNITKSEKAKMKVTGVIGQPLDGAKKSIVNQSLAPEQIMRSTIQSGLSIDNHSSVAGSNKWVQSQNVGDKQQKMMATTGVISQNPSKKLITQDQAESEIVQPQETETHHQAVADGGQITDQGVSLQGKKSDVNLPASPASKPISKISINRPTPLDLTGQASSIAESLMDDSPEHPVSAGPIIRLDQPAAQATGFGIRLQKLEVASNLSVSKPQENFSSAQKASLISSANKNSVHDQSILQTPSASIIATGVKGTPDKDSEEVKAAKAKLELTEPLPILPKVTTVIHMPVKCPIENVRFVQLKRFQQFQKQHAELMSAGFDLVGQRRKMIQLKTEDKIKKGGGGIDGQEQLAKIDDTTHFIKMIVYARDPKIIDQEKQHVHQRDAFAHLNNLDVKSLVAKTQYLGEESKFTSLSPRNVQRLRPREAAKVQLDSQIYKLKDPEDKTLLFESRFESGNLYLAQKVSDQEYNLLMSNDINTQGHTQWFFFQVRNTRAKNKVRFNILNYSKPDSLFNYGMKISVYSDKKSERKNMGWHKDGEDIRYFQNGIRKDVTYYSKSYYTATFTYTFEYDDDIVYFAYSVPYTYSDLRNDISAIESDPNRCKLLRKAVLCRTLSGEPCEVLTITSADNLENFRQRKGVVITARVHPGETVGSWMMRGTLTFLTDPDNVEARLLRENFVFKVVPMLNPDGVINGNYRCSLAGCDLNRRWKTPNKTLHPTIFHMKRLIKQIHQERGLVLFCDLHGHSRKQNVFMYGCNNKQNPGECRIFPFILAKMNQYFCYEYSRFGVQKSKESTARVAIYKELKNVPNIYTMESSFAGLDMGASAGKHLTTDMLETLGHDVCRAILIYSNLYVPPELTDQPFFKNILLQQQAAKKQATAGNLDKKKFKEPALNLKDAIMGAINSDATLLNNTGGDDSSSGSDSAPSEDNMQAEELIKQLPTVDKTLKNILKKNEIKRKNEEAAQAQSAVKLRRPSSGRNLKKDEPPKRQMSPLKKAIATQRQEEPKPEEKKKPKVETKDASTQTDRADYPKIKEKMLKERKMKELAALQLAQQQKQVNGQPASVSTERKLINDLNGMPSSEYVSKQQQQQMQLQQQKQHQAMQQMNTTARLQQMVNLDSKLRPNQGKMPLSQHFSQNPINQNMQQPSYRASNMNQAAANQKIMIPDKNKYNFMGVSSIKHGQPQFIHQAPSGSQPQTHDSEYGTAASSLVQRTGAGGANSAKLSPSRPDAVGGYSQMRQDSHKVYQTKQQHGMDPSQRQKIQETMKINQQAKNMELEVNMIKGESRKSGNRNATGGQGELLPAMTTLSANTNRSMRDQQIIGAPGAFNANNKLNNHTNNGSILNQQKGGSKFQMAQRSQNFETEPSTQRMGKFSPTDEHAQTKPSFMLPQTKQLPQKEFKMMEVGGLANNQGRKGSRNPKSVSGQNPTSTTQPNGSQSQSQKSYGQAKLNSTSSYQSSQQPNMMQPQQMPRFNKNQQPPNMGATATDQSLARNNSTHCNVVASGMYAGPLGSSPMAKVGQGQIIQQQNVTSPADQYSSQLQEMSLTANLVTRNNAVVANTLPQNSNSNVVLSGGATSSHGMNNNNKTISNQPLRASYNTNQFTPQSKPGQWQQNNNQFMTENSAAANQQYRVMGGSQLPATKVGGSSNAEHDQNCSKLPSLNLRGQQQSTRSDSKSFHHNRTGTNSHQNASGMIGGLNIVLNSGQGSLQTPNQKKSYQISGQQHPKFQSNIINQQMVPGSMQVLSGSNRVVDVTQPDGGTTSAQSQVVGGPNNSSSAAHKRNAHGAIFSVGDAHTNNSGHPMPFTRKSGSKTPSQSDALHASRVQGEHDALPKQTNRAGLHLHVSPAALGSLSLENNQLHDFDLAQSPQLSKDQMIQGHTKPLGGSMVSRLRNQSEIADTRNNAHQQKQQNYGTFDARAIESQPRQGHLMSTGPNVSHNQMILTPQVNNYGKKNILGNSSQSKVVGKRYSRH